MFYTGNDQISATTEVGGYVHEFTWPIGCRFKMVSNMFFMFTPILGEMIQFDEHIFQLGWNHQLPVVRFFMSLFFWGPWKSWRKKSISFFSKTYDCRCGCDRWQGPGDRWGGEMKSETLRVEIQFPCRTGRWQAIKIAFLLITKPQGNKSVHGCL